MMRACQETLYPTWGETEKTPAEHLTYRQSLFVLFVNLWYRFSHSKEPERRTATNRVGLVRVRPWSWLSCRGRRFTHHQGENDRGAHTNAGTRAAWVCFGQTPLFATYRFWR